MLRRYRKKEEDMPLSATKIEDDTLSVDSLQQKRFRKEFY